MEVCISSLPASPQTHNSTNFKSDGTITQRIAEQLTDGYILGIDSSPAMIAAAVVQFGNTPFAQLRYKDFDASTLFEEVERQERAVEQRALMGAIETEILDLTPGAYTKIFSNAALHWYVSSPLSVASIRLFFPGLRSEVVRSSNHPLHLISSSHAGYPSESCSRRTRG